jgi:hypothetical protein
VPNRIHLTAQSKQLQDGLLRCPVQLQVTSKSASHKHTLQTFVDGRIRSAGRLDPPVTVEEEGTEQRLEKRILLRKRERIDVLGNAVMAKLTVAKMRRGNCTGLRR